MRFFRHFLNFKNIDIVIWAPFYVATISGELKIVNMKT